MMVINSIKHNYEQIMN